jgi:hypothetical protein
MSRNDPTHNLKWNAKENPGFFQPNQLDLAGSKQWHQKDILKLKPSTSMKIVSTINKLPSEILKFFYTNSADKIQSHNYKGGKSALPHAK